MILSVQSMIWKWDVLVVCIGFDHLRFACFPELDILVPPIHCLCAPSENVKYNIEIFYIYTIGFGYFRPFFSFL